jgi:hypothetical protein
MCLPDASWAGAPDSTQSNTPGASDFVVTFGAMSQNKPAVVVLGKGAPMSIAWSAQSTRCLPLFFARAGVQNTGDSNGAAPCGGSVSFAVEAYLQGGGMLSPAAAGDDYVVQACYRDPLSAKTSQMSAAVRFTVCP